MHIGWAVSGRCSAGRVTARRPLPPELRRGPFLGSVAVAAGLTSPRVLRGTAVVRLFRDAYVAAGLAVDHVVRCRALALVVPVDTVFAGVSAAALHGLPGVDPDDPVTVAVPGPCGRSPVVGVAVRRVSLRPGEVVVRHGLRVTSPDRTLFDLAARQLPVPDAVVLVDAALARWPVLSRLDETPPHPWAGWYGSRKARTVLAMADGRAESPAESRLRVHLALARMAAPEIQWPVRDRNGRFLARVDLAWPRERFAVEYDGLGHAAPDAFAGDRARLDALTCAGWQVAHVTHRLVREGWDAVVAHVRRSHDAAVRRSAA